MYVQDIDEAVHYHSEIPTASSESHVKKKTPKMESKNVHNPVDDPWNGEILQVCNEKGDGDEQRK